MLLFPYKFVNHNQDEVNSLRDSIARDLQSNSLNDFNFCNEGEEGIKLLFQDSPRS